MKRLIFYLLVIILISGCEWENEFIKMEIIQYPDKIVYYINETDELDLSGGKVKLTTRSGDEVVLNLDGKDMIGNYEFEIFHDIDFNKEGEYVVLVKRTSKLTCEYSVTITPC